MTALVDRAQAHADVLRQYGSQKAGFVNLHTSDLVAYGEILHELAAALRAVREAPVVRVAPGAVKDSGWIMYADDGDGMPVELPFKSDSAVYLVPVGEGEA